MPEANYEKWSKAMQKGLHDKIAAMLRFANPIAEQISDRKPYIDPILKQKIQAKEKIRRRMRKATWKQNRGYR